MCIKSKEEINNFIDMFLEVTTKNIQLKLNFF